MISQQPTTRRQSTSRPRPLIDHNRPYTLESLRALTDWLSAILSDSEEFVLIHAEARATIALLELKAFNQTKMPAYVGQSLYRVEYKNYSRSINPQGALIIYMPAHDLGRFVGAGGDRINKIRENLNRFFRIDVIVQEL